MVCNGEFQELIPRLGEVNNLNVNFISLSAAGWSAVEIPTTEFLQEWQQKHQIPFDVAASSRDPGIYFFKNARVPSVVIIDQKRKLAFKKLSASIDEIFEEIKRIALEPSS